MPSTIVPTIADETPTTTTANAAPQQSQTETKTIEITFDEEWVRDVRESLAARNREFAEDQRARVLAACREHSGGRVRGVHPVCDLLPLIGGDELLGLSSDIRAHGLIHPVVIHEGQLLDGRNRLLACEEEGVKPRFIDWRDLYKGPMTVTRWIWSINVERRHLTMEQILALEVAVHAYEETEAARQRQKAGKSADGTAGGRGHKKNLGLDSSQGLSASPCDPPQADAPPRAEAGRVREKLANETGATDHQVRQALAVKKADPALLKEVVQGKTTLKDAAKKVTAKKVTAKKVAPPKPKPEVTRGAIPSSRIKKLPFGWGTDLAGKPVHEARYLMMNIDELVGRLHRVDLLDCAGDDRLFVREFAGKCATQLREVLARVKAPDPPIGPAEARK
jgi:hypothetical protein